MRSYFVVITCITATFSAVAQDTNLLLITIDTLRADHLGCYGYERQTSPTIDLIAKEGVLFEQTISPRGSTAPALTSLLTSQYPITHGVRTNGQMSRESTVMLAEILSEHGFAAAAFMGNASKGNWQGFDEHNPTDMNDEEVADHGIRWLRENSDVPFFLWLHFAAPHMSYNPPRTYRDMFVDPDYQGTFDGELESLKKLEAADADLSEADQRHLIDLYDGEIRFDDDLVNRVIKAVEDMGLLDETLVVFSSDHGETLYERNRLFGHASSIHEGVLRVPLILRFPRVLPAAHRISSVVELIDVAPTILELLGIPVPSDFQGSSLMPLIRGDVSDSGPAFSEWRDKMLAIRTDTHRYVFNPTEHHPRRVDKRSIKRYGISKDSLYVVEKEELFDIVLDRGEHENILGEHPETVHKLRSMLMRWRETYGWELSGGSGPAVDEDLIRELEALGYVL